MKRYVAQQAKIRLLTGILALVGLTVPVWAQNPGTFSTVVINASCVIRSGSGSPEGAVTGNVCDVYLRTNGSSGATIYVKETGTGNTGWAAPSSGSAPSSATYITQTADGTLSAEQALASLSSGLMFVTTATGAVTSITPTDDNVVVGDGSTWAKKTVPSCTDTGGNHLNYDQSTNTISCGTSGAAGSGAPSTATYITQTADGTLSAEQALGSLSTGIMKSTTTTGVVSTLAIPLTMANGGTDVSSASDDQVLVNSGSAWVAKTVPDCTDTGGNHLNYTQSTNAISCGTSGGGGSSAGWTFITSSTANTSPVDFTGLSTYKELMVICDQCVSSTTAVIQMLVSTNNGSSFLNASGDYKTIDSSSYAGANDTTMSSSNNGSGTRYTVRFFMAFNETKPHYSYLFTTATSNNAYVIPTTTALNAIRVQVHTGTFNSGTIYVYGKT